MSHVYSIKSKSPSLEVIDGHDATTVAGLNQRRKRSRPVEEEVNAAEKKDSASIIEVVSSSDDDDDEVVTTRTNTLPKVISRRDSTAGRQQASTASAGLKGTAKASESSELWTTKIPVSPDGDLNKGWIIHTRLPKFLQVMGGGGAVAGGGDGKVESTSAVGLYPQHSSGGSETDRFRSQKEALDHLLSLKPEKHGQVVMWGKTVDVPRYQKAFLRDYTFTGVHHEAEPNLPPILQELLVWANSQSYLWAPPTTDFWKDGIPTATIVEMAKPSWKAVVGEATRTPKPNSTNNDLPKVKVDSPPEFNSALVNWYMDGNHYIGPHSDDERELFPHSPILSATLGATRTFRFRDKTTNATVKDCTLRSGDLVIMGGACQQNFKHEIVKITSKTKITGPRVNITFRMFR